MQAELVDGIEQLSCSMFDGWNFDGHICGEGRCILEAGVKKYEVLGVGMEMILIIGLC